MKKKLVILGLILGVAFGAKSQQDQHFSMFMESPVYLNPGAAGFSPGNLQVFTNYRLQWSAISDNPYRTISAGADWRMFDVGGSYMGAGVIFYNDVAGASQFTTNVIALPINYALMVNKANFVSFGLQPGFYQRSLGNTQLTWDSQWNGVEFDPALSSNELLLSQNLSIARFDIGAGVYWESYLNKDAKIALGLSGQHLTKQRVNFTNDDDRLYRKLNLYGKGEFKRPLSNLTVVPSFAAFLQGPNKELVAGSSFRFQLKGASRTTSYFDEISLTLGTHFRVGDAIIFSTVFDMAGLSIGASYDLNVSSLNVATRGVGAMEFFLRYRLQFGNRNLRNLRVH